MNRTNRVLLKGNEAAVYGALLAGCECYFGYPITPASEIAAFFFLFFMFFCCCPCFRFAFSMNAAILLSHSKR